MVVTVREKETVETFMRQDIYLHLYEFGNLDDVCWPHTTWYALEEAGAISAMFLLYRGKDEPFLYALEDRNRQASRALLESLLPTLPDKFNCHVTPGLENVLAKGFRLEHRGRYHKTRLASLDAGKAPHVPGTTFRFLNLQDTDRLVALYALSYPGTWFDTRLLATGKYVGLFDADNVVAVAGVHVYSAGYGVASLGNVATHPDYRGRGAAPRAAALLCEELLKTVPDVGTSVHAKNPAAVRIYEKIGFKLHSDFDAYAVHREGTYGK